MSQSQELVRSLLIELCRSDAEADAVLVAAQRLAVDPLDYCIHRSGLGADEVMRRAANWAGLAFSPTVPSTGGDRIDIRRLDGLAEAHSVRERLFDREVIYIAPGFDEFIRLKTYVAGHPDVRRTTCVAPARAIRRALAEMSAGQLLDEARQRLVRRWPFASADLDLGWVARGSFVAVAAALALLATVAPLLLQTVLLPLIGLVLLAPALFRLAAVARNPDFSRPSPAPALTDRELPVYTVLIPLNDEAHMVPLLRQAMTALD